MITEMNGWRRTKVVQGMISTLEGGPYNNNNNTHLLISQNKHDYV